jgi:very-short-patch-repair endonuclease
MRLDSTPPPASDDQDGVFTVQQAIDAGTSRKRVRRLLDRGAWVVVVGSVLAPATSVVTPVALARAAALAVGLGAVVSHLTAAYLHGLRVPHDKAVHLIVGRDRRVRIENLRTHRVEIADAEVELVDGILRTTLSRTVLDCLLWLSEEQGRDMLTDAVRRRLITLDEVAAVVSGSAQRHGIGRAWAVLADVGRNAHSEGEVRMHRLLRKASLAGWAANVPVYDAHGLIGIVDVLFAQAKVVLEIDGFAYHAGVVEFQRDRARRNRLVAAGYTVLNFTWHDLTREPQRVLAEIRAALALAA